VPESNLARIPAELDWVQAGAMPEVFITAHDALFTRAGLHVGECVLIHAAASGVGTAAIQVAHTTGATVYGTSRTADKLQRLHELNLGLDQSVAVGNQPANFVEAVQKWTNGAGVDVILDLVGGNYFAANLEALASRGLVDQVRGYPVYGDYSRPDPQRGLVDDVARGRLDVAIVWGPQGGYYAGQQPVPLDVTPVRESHPAAPFDFAIAMGVRRGDEALSRALDQALARHAGEIRRILSAYGVPLS